MYISIFRDWAEFSGLGSIETFQATCIETERGTIAILADTDTASGSIFYYPLQTLESITPLDKPDSNSKRLEFKLVGDDYGDPTIHLVYYHPRFASRLDNWIADVAYHFGPTFGPIQVDENS